MIVLKIAGLAVGGLAALLLVAVLGLCLLMVPRVGLDVHAKNGGYTLRVRYGWLHKTIRLPEKRQEKSVPENKEPKTAKEAKEKSGARDLLSRIDVGDVVCEVLDFLDDVKDRLRIDVLTAKVVLATGDAARTGLLLGSLSAMSGIIYPFLVRNFTMHTFAIDLDGDFNGSDTQYDLRLACSFRPIRMAVTTIRHGLRLYRMIRPTKNMEAKTK